MKTHIKIKIMRGLLDSNSQIRVTVAYVISKIAHLDWPESWPHLFDELMALLKSGVPEQVHGATRVLAEFVRDDITDQQFPYIAPILLPELYSVFVSEVGLYVLFTDENKLLISSHKNRPIQARFELVV